MWFAAKVKPVRTLATNIAPIFPQVSAKLSSKNSEGGRASSQRFGSITLAECR
jgi:hypothetical protein